MSESDMRGKVIKALKSLDAFAVENPARPGTPDVNYIEGWLELKWLRAWPKRETTPVTIDHYTPHQRVFHQRRWNAGGNLFVLLQVQNDWLLFTAPCAAQFLGLVPRQELFDHAYKRWATTSEMIRHLKKYLQR